MSSDIPRHAPAHGVHKQFRLLGPGEKAIALTVFPLMLTMVLQFLTQILVLALLGRRDLQVLTVWGYLGQWGTLDPPARYGVAGAAALHWGIIIATILGVIFLIRLVAKFRKKRREDPQRRPGLASIEQVKEELGTEQLMRRGPALRPSTTGTMSDPKTLGFLIGTFRGLDTWLRVEDPTILIGPSRAGKGWRFLLRWIINAPGAVITTSSKLDNFKTTKRARERRGSKVWLFAPGVPDAEAYGHTLRWDPIAGCVDEATLVRRVKGLIPGDSFAGSTSNGGHWDTLGQQLASHLFHAAACGGVDVDRIWDWVGNPNRALEAVKMIREHPQGLREHASHLESVINMPHEQRASQWGVLPTVLAFMDSRSARDWMKPVDVEEQFDAVKFVLDSETVYMVGDKAVSAGYMRIIDGLFAELDYVTKGLASASPGNRLDPAVTYILDELGNFEYHGLYELITAGGGLGRVVVAVFQSKSQLRQYGGEDAEKTLWDAATVKIILPGGSDYRDLEEMANLIGQTWVERESNSLSEGGTSAQFSEDKQHIFEASEIRQLKSGYAFVFYRNLPPIVAWCKGFDAEPEFKQCMDDSALVTAEARGNTEFAAALDEHLEAKKKAHRA
ncbi:MULTISPECIES: type IV secretory system conjugative DNA transfer family protein [unclassified Leucobacter]|uniref:type IV secretory system conjugative DNA transfer family protein n=1 Tax=unclassified Leucobacter TaxID=2621730 RepID=UPI003017EE61